MTISQGVYVIKFETRDGVWNPRPRQTKLGISIGGFKEGARDAPRVKILSFSCSFLEKFGQIIGSPRLGNPGSATDQVQRMYSLPQPVS